jgi:hypothetical protein
MLQQNVQNNPSGSYYIIFYFTTGRKRLRRPTKKSHLTRDGSFKTGARREFPPNTGPDSVR